MRTEGCLRRRYQKYMIAISFVGLWAVFSHAYLGTEDGSSGLSPPGWIHAMFFLPGGLLLQAVKEGHSNVDLPLMAACSLCVYMVALVLCHQGWGTMSTGHVQSGSASRWKLRMACFSAIYMQLD